MTLTSTSTKEEVWPLEPRQPRQPSPYAAGVPPEPASAIAGRGPAVVTKPWAHFVAGGVGGMTAALLTSPLDVLKTRLQSDFYQSQLVASRAVRGVPPPESLPFLRSSVAHFRETFQILFAIPRVEGVRALFKGLGPTLTGIVPASAIKFYTYGNCKRIIADRLNEGRETAWVHLLAAATAGVVVSTATNPIWLVKTRLQLDKSRAARADGAAEATRRRYKNSLDCTMQILRQEGIRGLYRGLSASYLGVTESTLQWVLYEQMKMYLARREARVSARGGKKTTGDQVIDWVGKLGAAGSAKLVAAVVTYPHEVWGLFFSFPLSPSLFISSRMPRLSLRGRGRKERGIGNQQLTRLSFALSRSSEHAYDKPRSKTVSNATPAWSSASVKSGSKRDRPRCTEA